MDDLESLVRGCQLGDELAFRRLVERFKGTAYAYAYSLLGDFHLAEDAAQEAFINAWTKIDSLRIPAAFPSWFRRIVYKHCDRSIRSNRRESIEIEDPSRIIGVSVDPVSRVIENDLREQVLDAIRRLPGEKRAVVTLCYMNGYTMKEISEFLQIPVGTVKSRLSDSKKQLKKEMLAMSEKTFSDNRLSEGFTEETIQKAIRAASNLHAKSKYDEAETILSSTLKRAPNHPGLLKEMNRNAMHGRIYRKGEWYRLSEIAVRGEHILESTSDDEDTRHQMNCWMIRDEIHFLKQNEKRSVRYMASSTIFLDGSRHRSTQFLGY